MMETTLLLLLALGGGTGSPAASPGLAPGTQTAAPITGVWRGTWHPAKGRSPVPVEAVVAPGRGAGTLIAVIGEVKGDGVGIVPGDGALELTRVRR